MSNRIHRSHKICYACKRSLRLRDFAFANRAKGYRASRCRSCQAAYMRAYREAHREELNANSKRCREARIEHYRQKNRDWNAAHSDALRAARRRHSKKYYAANREALLAYSRTYYAANRDVLSAKRRAKREESQAA
jgi:hypothetical protein